MRGGWTHTPFAATLLLLVALLTGLYALYHVSDPLPSNRTGHPGASKLVPEEVEHNFGIVDHQVAKQLRHEFKLVNTSQKTVRILKKSSSCTCTSADLKTDRLDPGETLPVLVEADWANRAGSQTAQVWIETDEPSKPQIILSVAAYIKVSIAVLPGSLQFGLLLPGESHERSLYVYCDKKQQPNLKVVKVEGSDDSVIIREVRDQPVENIAAQYAIKLVAPRFATPMSRWVRIYLSDREKPAVIPIFGTARGALEADRKSIALDVGGGNSERQKLRVRALAPEAGSTFSVTVAREDVEGAFSVNSDIDGETNNISVACESMPEGMAMIKATLRVTHGMDAIELPVIATRKP